MTKNEIMTNLKELGIKFDPSQKKEVLYALLPKEEKKPEEPATEKEETEVFLYAVFDSKFRLVRTYTVAIHGQIAEQLAEQFAQKIGGTVQIERERITN